MDRMKISIDTNSDKFYRQILEILSIFPPISLLRPKEKDILSEIMKQNNDLRSLSKAKRKMLIFSTQNRKEMQAKYNISFAFLNVIFSTLRKYNLIGKDGSLVSVLDIQSTDKYSIEIELRTKHETKNN